MPPAVGAAPNGWGAALGLAWEEAALVGPSGMSVPIKPARSKSAKAARPTTGSPKRVTTCAAVERPSTRARARRRLY